MSEGILYVLGCASLYSVNGLCMCLSQYDSVIHSLLRNRYRIRKEKVYQFLNHIYTGHNG